MYKFTIRQCLAISIAGANIFVGIPELLNWYDKKDIFRKEYKYNYSVIERYLGFISFIFIPLYLDNT